MMRFILPVAALAVALAALLMTPHDTRLFGLNHQQFASAAIGVSLLLWLVLIRLALGAAERHRAHRECSDGLGERS